MWNNANLSGRCPGPGRSRPMSRRAFLGRAGGGFGMLALAALLGRDGLLTSTAKRSSTSGGGCPIRSRRNRRTSRRRRSASSSCSCPAGRVTWTSSIRSPTSSASRASRSPNRSARSRRAARVAKNKLLRAAARPSSSCGQSGIEVSDFLPHIAELRRRHLPAARLPRRQRHASRVGVPDEHRLDPHGPAEPRRVGHLRARHREPEHAGVRRHARSRRLGEGRRARVGQRLPAGDVSGHASARRRVAHPASQHAEGRQLPNSSRRRSTSSTSSTANTSPRGDDDSELAARIAAYELAFRMQTHAPEVVDISKETDATRKTLRAGQTK